MINYVLFLREIGFLSVKRTVGGMAMNYRPYVQSRHIVEHNNDKNKTLNGQSLIIEDWLIEQGVDFLDYTSDETNEERWEIDKGLLEENITEDSYESLPEEIRESVKELIKRCLEANTGNIAYVDWF